MARPLRHAQTDTFVRTDAVSRLVDAWLLDCKYRRLSAETITNRRNLMVRFQWWLQHEGHEICGTPELKAFLVYVGTGHQDGTGRWGNPLLTKPVRPRTVKDYHTTLRTFFRWLEEEGHLDASPMETIKSPVARADQIQPFTEEQMAALLVAAKSSKHPRRDEAIVLLLLDSGMRSSELCGLTMDRLDLPGKRAVVLGKGNKHRSVYFSRPTARALTMYLRDEERKPNSPVFAGERSEGMTRSGLQQLLERLGQTTHIGAVRCLRCTPCLAHQWWSG